MTNLIENQYVRVASAAAVFVVVIGVVVAETRWKSRVRHDIDDAAKERQREFSAIRQTLQKIDGKIVGKTSNGWHRTDMEEWSLRAELQNQDPGKPWKAPDIKWAVVP